MIRLLTIDREYGSGGGEIAEKVAERLGWKLWDQLLTSEIARSMDCECVAVEPREEHRDPLYYRLFKSFMRGSYEGSLNAPRLKMVDADCIREIAERVIIDAAKQGNSVIVGRGSAYYLRDRPDAFHVFVHAPFEEKVNRLRQLGKDEEKAIRLVETVDRDRAAYIKQYFEVEWPDRRLFHLMINSTIGEDAAVDTILTGVAAFDKQPA
jgi:cytidylate kinase